MRTSLSPWHGSTISRCMTQPTSRSPCVKRCRSRRLTSACVKPRGPSESRFLDDRYRSRQVVRPLAPGDVSLDLLSHAVGQRPRVPMLVQQLPLAASESIFRTFSELNSNWNACEGIEECKVVPVVCTIPTASVAGIATREESTGSRGFKPATPRVARRTGDVAVTGMPSPTRLRDRSRSGRIGWLARGAWPLGRPIGSAPLIPPRSHRPDLKDRRTVS